MAKSDVLEVMGNPSKSRRVSGADEWTYEYYKNDVPNSLTLKFQDGRLSQIGTPENEILIHQLKSADSLEDYEQKARAFEQQQKEKTPEDKNQ